MISIATGRVVGELLAKVTARPWLYTDVVLCSPFIDAQLEPTLHALCRAAVSGHCSVTLIGSFSAIAMLPGLRRAIPGRPLRVVRRRNLHSKVYVLRARHDPTCSEALVTSANMTIAALQRNDELGVHIQGTTQEGRALLRQVDRSVSRLSTPLTLRLR